MSTCQCHLAACAQETGEIVDGHNVRIEQLPRVSGRLCLDFANTIEGRADPQPREYMHSYEALIRWSVVVGILTDEAARHLLVAAATQPDAATSVLTHARTLREAIYGVFSAVAAGQDPDGDAFAILQQAITTALAHAEVVRIGDHFVWGWREQQAALDWMLWPVARSVADVLTSSDVERVRECPGDYCSWLFVDDSRNHRRRWCSMQMCGDKVKARHYYARHRGTRGRGNREARRER